MNVAERGIDFLDGPNRKRVYSPTCRDCALAAGLEPSAPYATMYEWECENCGALTSVSAIRNWRCPDPQPAVGGKEGA